MTEKLEKPKLEDILAPLSSSQRQYICLRLIGMSNEEARVTITRRPDTIDQWLVQEDFKEVQNYVLSNKEVFKAEALAVWAVSLTAKARYFLEALLETGLNEIVKEGYKDMGLLKLATTAAGLLHRISGESSGKPIKESYDNRVIERFILERQRPLGS